MTKREWDGSATPKNTKTSDSEDKLEDTTPLVTVWGAQSSVEIKNNAVQSFPTIDAAASFAFKYTQIKTVEGAELPAEQSRGCISQFSVNCNDEVVEFQLNVYSILLWQYTLPWLLCMCVGDSLLCSEEIVNIFELVPFNVIIITIILLSSWIK